MDIREGTGDENAIRALIGAHFQGLKWTPTTRADWAKFAADFLPDASLFPAARPARAKTLDAFIERMKGAWRRSTESAFALGQILLEAEWDLPREGPV